MPVTLALPPTLIARLDALAEAEDRSRSAIVRRALERVLADHAPRTAYAEESERP